MCMCIFNSCLCVCLVDAEIKLDLDAPWLMRSGIKRDAKGQTLNKGTREGPFTAQQLLQKVSLADPPYDRHSTYIMHATNKVSTSGTGRKYLPLNMGLVHLNK